MCVCVCVCMCVYVCAHIIILCIQYMFEFCIFYISNKHIGYYNIDIYCAILYFINYIYFQ